MRLTLEPWAPDFDTSLHDEMGLEAVSYADLDLHVELEEWRAVQPSRVGASFETLYFIDGKRRTESRIFGQVEDERGVARTVPGLLGTVAVGLAKLNKPWQQDGGARAEVVRAEVSRVLVLAGDEEHPGLEIVHRLETRGLFYKFTTAEIADDRVDFALQKLMQRAEASVAKSLTDPHGLLIVDGTLHGKPAFGASLGYVKTIHNIRLPPDEQRTLTKLFKRGWRSPVFQIGLGKPGQEKFEPKFSWYVRLDDAVTWHQPMSGVVRLEVYAEVGRERAIEIADWSCHALPRLAAKRFRDPRAPQQLMPVAFLESELSRRMGDLGIVRRRIQAFLRELYPQDTIEETSSSTASGDLEKTAVQKDLFSRLDVN